MKISLIVAMDEKNGIGWQNQLPWHLPADLKHFKEMTLGKPIIMGRKTFESIGRPLPQRLNIVLTHQTNLKMNDVVVAHSLEEAISFTANQEIMVIGGEHIFRQMFVFANKLYVTKIHHTFKTDTYFPKIDKKIWHSESSVLRKKDESNRFDMTFMTYSKKD